PHPLPPDIQTLSLHDALPISFSKISTEGFHAVVDAGASQSLPKKPPNRAGSVLNSRKGSHLMSDIRLVSFQRLLDAASGLIHALDRKSTRLNSSHDQISYAVF